MLRVSCSVSNCLGNSSSGGSSEFFIFLLYITLKCDCLFIDSGTLGVIFVPDQALKVLPLIGFYFHQTGQVCNQGE